MSTTQSDHCAIAIAPRSERSEVCVHTRQGSSTPQLKRTDTSQPRTDQRSTTDRIARQLYSTFATLAPSAMRRSTS